jgi:hypothetical protein
MITETTAGRIDMANLSAGKVLGTADLDMGGLIGKVNLTHTVKSNNGTQVVTSLTTLITLGGTSIPFEVASGLFENMGQDGARLRIDIANLALFDGSLTTQVFQFPVPIGSVFVNPAPAGKTFDSVSTLTSVLYPLTNGRASSNQYRQTFSTVP